MAGICRIISGAALFAALAIALLAGCSGPGFNWEGTWTGRLDYEAGPGEDPYIVNTMAKVEITIHAGGTFDLFESGLPKSGNVSFSGGKAYLKIDRIMDRPIRDQGSAAEAMNHEIVLTPVDDSTVLYEDPGALRRNADGARPEPVKLERKTQPSQTG